MHNVFIKPKLTEKSLLQTKNGVYAFEVVRNADKNQIKHAVESIFNVKVASVQTAVKKGKSRRVGRLRAVKKLTNTKVAYVVLKSGKIDIFPQE